jgi:hypothetical protein
MSHREAATPFLLPALLTLALGCVDLPLAWAEQSHSRTPQVLTIEEAIEIAKQCIIHRNVRVVGSFIESARFDRNHRGDREPVWRVTWAHSREIKGGQVFVTVLSDRTCEITFGE